MSDSSIHRILNESIWFSKHLTKSSPSESLQASDGNADDIRCSNVSSTLNNDLEFVVLVIFVCF